MKGVQEEYIQAVQGAIMSLMDEYRHAEDEDHTEVGIPSSHLRSSFPRLTNTTSLDRR